MASRNYNRMQALTKEAKELHITVAIGASGAPTVTNEKEAGTSDITRNAAGEYTLTLQDKYVRLLAFQDTVISTAQQDSKVQVTAEDVAGAKTIDFTTSVAGTPTDLADGDTLLLTVKAKNSTSGE